jgi:hypothetical protein
MSFDTPKTPEHTNPAEAVTENTSPLGKIVVGPEAPVYATPDNLTQQQHVLIPPPSTRTGSDIAAPRGAASSAESPDPANHSETAADSSTSRALGALIGRRGEQTTPDTAPSAVEQAVERRASSAPITRAHVPAERGEALPQARPAVAERSGPDSGPYGCFPPPAHQKLVDVKAKLASMNVAPESIVSMTVRAFCGGNADLFLDTSLTTPDLAQRLGKSEEYVERRRDLLYANLYKQAERRQQGLVTGKPRNIDT